MQFPWSRADRELDREIGHHLEMLAEAHQRAGHSREEAMRMARRDFGGLDATKEACRDERASVWLAHFFQDLRFGWRVMRRTPAITLAAVLSLALGIGATTSILSLADVLLIRTLPVPAPEQLVEVLWTARDFPRDFTSGASGAIYPDDGQDTADFFSGPAWQSMRRAAGAKAEIAAHILPAEVSASLRGTVMISRLRGVSGNFFSTLRVVPQAGRLIAPSDDRPEAVPAIVVTHRFWTTHMGRDAAAVGKPVRINNTAYTLIGVLPPSFHGIVPGDSTDIYAPLHQSPAFLAPDSFHLKGSTNPDIWAQQLFARRAPGVSDTELTAMLQGGFAATWTKKPKSREATPQITLASAERGLGAVRRRIGDPVVMLLGLVVLVLVVTCANIGNLLLARAAAREKEVGLRVSLGCSQARLRRQFFTESLLLAAIGGVLSILVSAVVGSVIIRLMSSAVLGMVLTFEPDLRSFLGTAVVTLLTALLFGLYPAIRTARLDPIVALKQVGTGPVRPAGARWLPARTLVLLQVALGVLLISAAVLYTTSLREMVNRDTGFERAHVVMFEVRPSEIGYPEERAGQFLRTLEERLERVPGVTSVGLSRMRPMHGGGWYDDIGAPGNPNRVSAAIHHATPGFMEALGVPVIAGRFISRLDVKSKANVAVLSEDLPRKLGLGSPIGAVITFAGEPYQVIGIAKTARYSDMGQTPSVLYVPFDYKNSAAVVVRTAIPPSGVVAGLRAAVGELDRNLPLVDVFTMEQQISRTLQREALLAWLCGAFGVLALVLCGVGVYGLTAHTTARRTPEIGIRIAIGASRRAILRQVVGDGMKVVGGGLIVGLAVAAYASRIASTKGLLPGGTEIPWSSVTTAVVVLTVAAFAAVLGPALRASSTDPMVAIRQGE